MSENEEYQPANYESDENDDVESCDSDSETEAEKQTKTRRTHQYAYKQTFEDHEKSGEWLKSQTTWASARFYETHAGRKQILRCNKVPVRAKECAASAYLLYNADSFKVMIFEDSEEHDNDEILKGVKLKGLTSSFKRRYVPYFCLT